jgi:homoserine acetyltransferase
VVVGVRSASFRELRESDVASSQRLPLDDQRRTNAPRRKSHEALAGDGSARFRADSVHRSGPELSRVETGRVGIAKDFKFHTGQVMPELRIGYTTVGEPSGQPVLILHGTGGSANSMLTPAFAGQLFGPDQPLDASRYFIIIPDSVGHGRTSKPSDGLKTKFPRYNYEDMVDAQYRLVRDGLAIRHLRLVMGNSMGGMHAWIWGVKYPDAMDALVPMASQPTERRHLLACSAEKRAS